MRKFSLTDLVFSVKTKQEIMNNITLKDNKIYLGLDVSLLMLGVCKSLPASKIQYSTEPLDGVTYMNILGIHVITPDACVYLLKDRLLINANTMSEEELEATRSMLKTLQSSKMVNVDELDIIFHELDSDYESIFDDYKTLSKDCWFFEQLENRYPQIIKGV